MSGLEAGGPEGKLPVAPAVAPRAAEDAAQDAADDATVAPPAIAPATVVPAIAPAAVVPAVAPATIVPAAVMPTTVVPAAIVPTAVAPAVAPPGELGLGIDADIGLGFLHRLFPGVRHRTAQRLQAGGDRLLLGRRLGGRGGRVGGGERDRQPHDAARQQGGQRFNGTTVLGRVNHAKSPS